MVFFQPTQGLVNSLSFQHLENRGNLYPYLRYLQLVVGHLCFHRRNTWVFVYNWDFHVVSISIYQGYSFTSSQD